MNATPKILLVEDERAQRLLYQQELEEEGFEVHPAKNGSEALRIVRDEEPDAVVLDIFLTGEDGLELMGKLLNINADLPVILHSAYGEWQDNWRGRIADAYVVKSSDLTKLRTTVQDVLRQRQKMN